LTFADQSGLIGVRYSSVSVVLLGQMMLASALSKIEETHLFDCSGAAGVSLPQHLKSGNQSAFLTEVSAVIQRTLSCTQS
jgi:hypothetical protein